MGDLVGSKVAAGAAHVIMNTKQIKKEFKKGEILVTTMTDPDWEPIMKMASAIITDKRRAYEACGDRFARARPAGNRWRWECDEKVLKTGRSLTVDASGSVGNDIRQEKQKYKNFN